MLLIMDGWGLGTNPAADAIYHAHTPFVDSLYDQYPHCKLTACGEAVGLPAGQMGNSEVGHLNLGAGRIVYQELQRINVAIQNNSLASNAMLLQAFRQAKETKKKLHFIGLLSDGGVHSHINHLLSLIDYAEANEVPQYFVHAFTDGRDTDPKGGLQYLQTLQLHLQEKRGKIASVCGRYYAMDRDKRWERVALAYQGMVKGEGFRTTDVMAAIADSYELGITDEFLKPIVTMEENEHPVALIEDEDIVICFNFRTDRCREITEALCQRSFPEQGMNPLALHFYTMTEYDATFQNVGVFFENDNLTHTLGEVLAAHSKTQIRIAETEKYPHVTFFFSGGREDVFEGEKRIICPSPKDVATYDQKPEMSAYDITNAIIPELENNQPDFVCLNFANADMVGHTGIWSAAIKAAETVDECVSRIVPQALANGYTIFLTADHGNSDYMINDDGSPNTAHSLNLVPFFVIGADKNIKLRDGKLGDVAPTILAHMGIPIPKEMTGAVLIEPVVSSI